MSFRSKATELYRRDEKAGGKLLTREERLKLIEVSSKPCSLLPRKKRKLTGNSHTCLLQKPSKNNPRTLEVDVPPLVFASSSRRNYTS